MLIIEVKVSGKRLTILKAAKNSDIALVADRKGTIHVFDIFSDPPILEN